MRTGSRTKGETVVESTPSGGMTFADRLGAAGRPGFSSRLTGQDPRQEGVARLGIEPTCVIAAERGASRSGLKGMLLVGVGGIDDRRDAGTRTSLAKGVVG